MWIIQRCESRPLNTQNTIYKQNLVRIVSIKLMLDKPHLLRAFPDISFGLCGHIVPGHGSYQTVLCDKNTEGVRLSWLN